MAFPLGSKSLLAFLSLLCMIRMPCAGGSWSLLRGYVQTGIVLSSIEHPEAFSSYFLSSE